MRRTACSSRQPCKYATIATPPIRHMAIYCPLLIFSRIARCACCVPVFLRCIFCLSCVFWLPLLRPFVMMVFYVQIYALVPLSRVLFRALRRNDYLGQIRFNCGVHTRRASHHCQQVKQKIRRHAPGSFRRFSMSTTISSSTVLVDNNAAFFSPVISTFSNTACRNFSVTSLDRMPINTFGITATIAATIAPIFYPFNASSRKFYHPTTRQPVAMDCCSNSPSQSLPTLWASLQIH